MRLAALAPLVFALTGCISATVTDLGTLGGTLSVAHDLNDDAVVVGHSTDPTGAIRPFIWRSGAMSVIPLDGPTRTFEVAQAVNARGQVVGAITTATLLADAWFWPGRTTTRLDGGTTESTAYDINFDGDVTGSWNDAGARHAVLWSQGTRRVLPTIAGIVSVGNGIGKHRQVVGYSTVEATGTTVHAVLWADGTTLDLGTLGGRNSAAEAITVGRWGDTGYGSTYIVGHSQTRAGAIHAFVWNGGRMRDLGTLPGHVASEALDISTNARIIVGSSTDSSGNTRACMWVDGTPVDLTSLLPSDAGWVLLSAQAVNNRRQVTGHGRFRGQLRAYLLTMTW